MSNSNDYFNHDNEEELDQEENNNLDNNEYFDDMQDNSSDNVKGKSPIRNFIKDPFGSISNGFKSIFRKKKKLKLKEIWKRIPLKFKIAIIVGGAAIILIVVLILSIGDVASKIAVEDRATGVSKLNITEESTEASKVALELYNKYDSLIGFTTEQLNVIFETFKENDTTRNKYLLSSGTKKMGNNGGDKFSPYEERTLYEHIQRTEKYNFNKIKWKSYTHTEDNVDMELEERSDLELFVPKGIDDTTLNTLLKTTAPYLLTQDIPLGILTGMVGYSGGTSSTNATTAEKFTYQIIKEALTKMTVNKYELETLKLQSSYDDCNYNTYVVDYTIRTYDNGYEEIVSQSQPRLDSTRNEKTNETKIDGTEQYTYETFWYVAEALTYDRIINNSFDHEKYSSDDVSNLTNPDSNNLINTVEINELYETIEPMITIDNGDTKKPSNGKYTDNSHTYKYTQKEGITYVYEKEWKDKLTVDQASNEVYNYNTAKEFNTKNNDNYSNIKTSKTIIEEAKFTQDNPEGNSLFDDLMDEDKRANLYGMSIIDLMNSNSGIYNQYIRRNSASSEYQAISRANLRPAYNQVKNIINVLVNKTNSEDTEENSSYTINSYTTGHAIEGAVPFVYGSSLGYETTDISMFSNNSYNYVSSMDLLRMFIHSFEGDGSTAGGGMYDENQNKTTDETKAKYYKVYDAKDDVYTVGFGVNINANFNKVKEALAEVGVTINSLDDIYYGMLLDKAAIDKVSDIKIQDSLDIVASETQGLDLTEYQVHALASRAYVHGTTSVSSGASAKPFKQFYEQYWNQEKDDQYETLYEQYKDNQTATKEIVSKVNFEHGLFTNCLDIYVSPTFDSQYPGYETRQRAEFTLFSTGYYSPLQTFYRKGGASPGDVQLLDSSGNVDVAACLELQMWFEENIFGNNIHAGTNIRPGAGSHSINLDPSIGKGQWYSAKTLEYAKKVGGGPHFEYKSHSGYKAIGENGLGIFQCTWWAQSRATLYLTDNGWTGSYIGDRGALGDGGKVAGNVSDQYGIPLNTDINNIRANSIASFSNGSGTGHVVYIEAVGNDYYVISHCGSGHTWYGVDIVPKGSSVFYNFKGSVCMDDLL